MEALVLDARTSAVLRLHDMPKARWVLKKISGLAERYGYCFARQTYLAKQVGLTSDRQLRTYLRLFEQAGVLSRASLGGQRVIFVNSGFPARPRIAPVAALPSDANTVSGSRSTSGRYKGSTRRTLGDGVDSKTAKSAQARGAAKKTTPSEKRPEYANDAERKLVADVLALARLREPGYAQSAALKFVRSVSENYDGDIHADLQWSLVKVRERMQRGNVEAPLGLLKQALREGWWRISEPAVPIAPEIPGEKELNRLPPGMRDRVMSVARAVADGCSFNPEKLREWNISASCWFYAVQVAKLEC